MSRPVDAELRAGLRSGRITMPLPEVFGGWERGTHVHVLHSGIVTVLMAGPYHDADVGGFVVRLAGETRLVRIEECRLCGGEGCNAA